jgi:hypothetical protein
MEAVMERMDAQLKLWGMKIFRLAARADRTGAKARFEDLMYVDELKALHAIAKSKFDEFRAAAVGDAKRTRLKAEMKVAWDDLDAAFKNPMP